MLIKKVSHAGKTYLDITAEQLVQLGVPQNVIDAAKSEQERLDVEGRRRVAYAAESDPLYMEWQYDNTPESEQAWRDKVAEIKARYPLPSAS
ncbi:hypothetical protein [Shewanella algae]|uniref:hypothetical protein n=1 Tax=Shewanella algae TaxID=38313 RepID=UPI0031F5CEAD